MEYSEIVVINVDFEPTEVIEFKLTRSSIKERVSDIFYKKFFGEKSFEVDDLMRIADDGRGMISVLRVTDLQDKPKLFSTSR